MDGIVSLVAAFAEEDRRLTDLVEAFPVALLDTPGRRHKLSLKQTLGHLGFWDDFAVEFYTHRLEADATETVTFDDFETRNARLMDRLRGEAWETVLASYRRATRDITAFLNRHWDELDEEARENFKIPLKHRRYHRRRLAELAEELGVTVPVAGFTEQAV